jgi:glutathione synthase/RimK-type ligase-like ATP-grasp enzyme
MNVLVLAGRESKSIKRLRRAFLTKGFARADYLSISKLNLLSRGGKTRVVNEGIKIRDYDAVFLRAKLMLSPFVEPLLDELKEEGIYTQFRPGAYYLNSNEALQLAALNAKGLPLAKSVVVANPKIIRDSTEKYRYPLIFKSYKGTAKTQSILVETPRSLHSLTKSIKMDLDAAIVREFEEADLIQCAVIGSRVFAVRRRWNGTQIEPLGKGMAYAVSDTEKATAIKAALACGCEVATVKLSRGLVTEVIPDINFPVFSMKTGEDLFETVAAHFHDRIRGIKIRSPKPTPSLFDRLHNFLEDVLHG